LILDEIRDAPEDEKKDVPLYYQLWDIKDSFPSPVREAIYYAAMYELLFKESDDSKRSPPPYLIEDGKINYKLLAETLIKRFCIVAYSPEGKRVDYYIYDGKRYIEGEKLIEKRAMELLWAAGYPENKKIKHHVSEVMEIISSRCMIKEFPFNKLTNFIPVKNGVLWVKDDGSVMLLPHSPVFGFQYVLPVKYDPSADCPKVKAFLRSLVNDDDSLEILYEIPASCMTRTTRFQFAYFLYGSGSNGKSTYLNLVERLLGEHNVSHISLQDLCHSRFRAAGLIGKLANIFSDLSSKMLRDTGMFKALTGEDSITIERKFKDPIYNYRNTARLIFSANEFPRTVDETDAFWRRWIIVHFPNKFRPNPRLLDEITTPDELSGFLNEVLKRLPKILECNPTINKDAKREWIRSTDSVRAFLEDCTVEDKDSFVCKEDLYNAYVEYCHIMDYDAVSNNAFARRVNSMYPSFRPRVGKKQKRAYKGIKLLPKEEWNTSEKQQEEKESEPSEVKIPSSDTERIMAYLNSDNGNNGADKVEYVKIKIIRMPVGTDKVEFVGMDGKVYSIGLGDVVEVPEENARPMLDKGYAMRVG